MTAPQALTVAQVAARLEISRSSVYELLATGHLASTNVAVKGTRTRVTEAALAAFLKSRTTPARKS